MPGQKITNNNVVQDGVIQYTVTTSDQQDNQHVENMGSNFNFHTRAMIDNTLVGENKIEEVNKNSYIFNNNDLNETTKKLRK